MLAHVHVMKTAGQTIRGILRQSFGFRHCDLLQKQAARPNDLQWAQRFYRQLDSIAGHSLVAHGDWPSAVVAPRCFTFLRDPVDRCVSHYQFSRNKFANYPSFDEWMKSHENFQTKALSDTDSAARAIEILESRIQFVGLVERFNESLILFGRWCDHPELDLRYRSQNIATDNRIKRELLSDPKTVERIRDRHQQDYALYEYARNVVYRRQVERFGNGLPAAVKRLEAALPGPRILSFQQLAGTAKRNFLYKPLTRYLRRAA